MKGPVGIMHVMAGRKDADDARDRLTPAVSGDASLRGLPAGHAGQRNFLQVQTTVTNIRGPPGVGPGTGIILPCIYASSLPAAQAFLSSTCLAQATHLLLAQVLHIFFGARNNVFSSAIKRPPALQVKAFSADLYQPESPGTPCQNSVSLLQERPSL